MLVYLGVMDTLLCDSPHLEQPSHLRDLLDVLSIE